MIAGRITAEVFPGPEPDSGGMPAIMGVFFAIFVIVAIASIVLSLVKFSRTRQMAMGKGATDAEATAIALSGDVGTAAAFIKPAQGPQGRSSAERIGEVRSLQSGGLITAEQAETRIAEILRGI